MAYRSNICPQATIWDSFSIENMQNPSSNHLMRGEGMKVKDSLKWEGELRTPTQSHVFISNATRVLYMYYRFEFLLMSRSNNFFNILFNVRNALSPVNDSITL